MHSGYDVTTIILDYASKRILDYRWPLYYISKPYVKEERFTPRLQPKCFYTIYAENGNFVDIEYATHVARSQVFAGDLPALFAFFSHHFFHLLQLDVTQTSVYHPFVFCPFDCDCSRIRQLCM